MANYAFNIAKGRAVELGNRVKSGDPAASRLYAAVIGTNVAQATGEDVDDFAAFITAGAVELAANNWNRKTLAAADITALVPDDVNNRFDLDVIDLVWNPGPTAGNSTGLVVCYASVATPTNAQLVPMVHLDMVVTADGNQVTFQVNAEGIFRGA